MGNPVGWVKLHRAITEHWIWSCERHSKQAAWMDLIMMANHEDRKIAIGNKTVLIKKGQMWTSYKKLKERWRWSNDRLKGFIDALVADRMIDVNPTRSGTLITICNYLIYQGGTDSDSETPVHESVHESVHKPVNTPVTNKNDIRMNKNDKKGAVPTAGKYEA